MASVIVGALEFAAGAVIDYLSFGALAVVGSMLMGPGVGVETYGKVRPFPRNPKP